MAHISYWMNAADAAAADCCISFPQLPAIESLRFLHTAASYTENTLYLGSPEELFRLLNDCPATLSLRGISFFLSRREGAKPDASQLNALARAQGCNLVQSSMDLFLLYDHLDQTLAQYRSWAFQLHDTTGSGHTIQDIVDTAARISGFSIFLLNMAYRVVFKHMNPEIQDPAVMALDARGELLSPLSQVLTDAASPSRVVFKELQPGYVSWIYKVTKQGTAISYMLFAGKSSGRSFDAYTLMDLTRQSIHQLMQKTSGPAYWAGQQFQSILKDIAESQTLDNYEINRRCSMISCGSGVFCTFVILGFCQPDTLSRLATRILTELEELFPDNNAAIYDDCIVLLLPRSTRIFQPRPIFDTKAFGALLRQYDAYASISNATSRRALMRTQYIMTKKILTLGRKLFPDSRERIYYYEDFAEYFMIELSVSSFRNLFGHDDIVLLIHPDAIKLMKYDKEHDTSLLEFVYHYCLCNCNINHTAKSAYMHRNTASSRLAKVHELILADLENGEVQQRMIFSYKVYRYYSRCSHMSLETRMEHGASGLPEAAP